MEGSTPDLLLSPTPDDPMNWFEAVPPASQVFLQKFAVCEVPDTKHPSDSPDPLKRIQCSKLKLTETSCFQDPEISQTWEA